MNLPLVLKIKITTILLLSAQFLSGQAKSPSPFSAFALGDRSINVPVDKIGLGTSSIQSTAPDRYNVTNSASAAFLNRTNVSLGVSSTQINLENEAGDTDQASNGAFYGVSLAFPLAETFGFGIALLPYSSAEYTSVNRPSDEKITTQQGLGGLSQLATTFSYRIAKDWSIGLGWNFIYGDLSKRTTFDTKESTYASSQQYTLNYRGHIFSLGLLGRIFTSETSLFEVGLEVKTATTNQQDLGLEQYLYITDDNVRYTTKKTTSQVDLEIPLQIGLGASYKIDDKWTFASNYVFYGESKGDPKWGEGTEVGHRATIGASWLPRRNSVSNYFEKIEYSFGAYFNQDGRVYQGKKLNEYALTAGFRLPMPSGSPSFFSLGFTYGNRSFDGLDVLKEQFFNAYLGITINELWFFKRTYD